MFFYADIFTMGVQYGNRVTMCETLVNNNEPIGNLMQAIAKMAKDDGVSYDQYDANSLSKTTIDINSNLR